MSECRLISQSMIPLSVSGVASKLLSLYAGPTLDIIFWWFASKLLYKLIILLNNLHWVLFYA